VEAKPFYSAAQAHRKRGDIPKPLPQSVAELAKFPNDFDASIAAEKSAENMNDIQARNTRFNGCSSPDTRRAASRSR